MANYLNLVHQKLWTLLEAHSPFASIVKPGNRIKYNVGKTDPLKLAMADADFPQVSIGQGDFTDSAFTATTNYQYTVGFNPASQPWKSVIEQTFTVNYLSNDLQIDKFNILTDVICKALRKGGPRLGYEFVFTWGPMRGGTQIVSTDDTGNRLRFVGQIAVPVRMCLKGSEAVQD